MRCLYCGKELALLKRWTRGAQFCSDAHNKSYQEEYNRIGLSRLLQAQNRPKAVQEAAPGSKPDPNVPGPNGATVRWALRRETRASDRARGEEA